MQYDLVFEGGGAKGMVFVGALQELERRGHTYGRLLGTSAGAITATFTAAGFTVKEMLDALKEKDEHGVPVFQQFLGRPRPFTPEEVAASATRATLAQMDVRRLPDFLEDRFDKFILQLMSHRGLAHIFSFVERGGWYSADEFLAWGRAKLDQTALDGTERNMSRMTFAEMHQATGRELSLVAADTTDHRMLVLNHRTAPRVPVVWGMRMSMSLPLLWQEVIWQPEWGAYLDRPMAGHRVVDGGLLSNFPIELFLSNDPHVASLMGSKTSQGVLGLLIDESLSVDGVATNLSTGTSPGISFADLQTAQRIMALIDTATQAHDKMVIESFEQFVCRLPANGYRTTEFNMTDERRERLIAAGQSATDHYFRAQETEGMVGPDKAEMERALRQADRLAGNILQ
jgi:predicted acylesterase/phospholipase RssA